MCLEGWDRYLVIEETELRMIFYNIIEYQTFVTDTGDRRGGEWCRGVTYQGGGHER